MAKQLKAIFLWRIFKMDQRKKNIKKFLLSLIQEMSDKEFQERTWDRQEGPEVSSIGELYCDFDYDFRNSIMV